MTQIELAKWLQLIAILMFSPFALDASLPLFGAISGKFGRFVGVLMARSPIELEGMDEGIKAIWPTGSKKRQKKARENLRTLRLLIILSVLLAVSGLASWNIARWLSYSITPDSELLSWGITAGFAAWLVAVFYRVARAKKQTTTTFLILLVLLGTFIGPFVYWIGYIMWLVALVGSSPNWRIIKRNSLVFGWTLTLVSSILAI